MTALKAPAKKMGNQIPLLKKKILELETLLKQVKSSEKALVKREHLYKDILNILSDGIAYSTLGGKLISMNRPLEDILEIPKEKLIGKNILDLARELLDKEEAAKIVKYLSNIIKGKDVRPFLVQYKDKILEVSTSINLYTKRITGSIRDITEIRRISGSMKETLLRKNRDLSKLFVMSLHLLETLDKRTVLQKIVDNAASLMGSDTSAIYYVKKENLILEVTSPIIPEDFPHEFRIAKRMNHPHINEVIEKEKIIVVNDVTASEFTPEEMIIITTRNLGSVVYIPLFIQQKVEGVIILGTIGRKHEYDQTEIDLFTTFSNITSLALENAYLFENLRITKEKAEESNKLKTAFLHNISHEIRTPLNAIIGFSAFLGQDDITPGIKSEFVKIISQSNKQLLSIIDDILNISHIEAGQIGLNESPTHLSEILENIFSQYQPEATKKGIQFLLNTAFPEHRFTILSDENKLIGIITNLLNNAFKFTQNGTIELGCNLNDEYIEIYVSDTGIGIPEPEQDKIFERFYQIDNSNARLYGGMGLGLSICDAYVKLLGGRFSVNSFPGAGSRFAFTVPFKKVATKEHKQNDLVSEGDLASGKTILVAEDEDSNFAFVHEILHKQGFRLLRAVNGSEAIDICLSNPGIDLILMDIRMPIKNGYESTAEILKFRPKLPIIAQTAYGYPEDKSQAMALGCIDYIIKPFSKDQLIQTVKKYLR